MTLENGEAFIDGVRIISTDIIADNGVVHLIEGVLTTPLDIVDTATIQGFGNLVAALDVAELDDDLMGDGPFTVFAPTDQAFEEAATALGTDIAGLLALDNLDEILLYHVVSGSVLASNLSDGLDVMTLNGASFTVLLNSGAAIDTDGDDAADATITATDLEVGNGVIHVIDAVLLPPAES
ncbi:MAG: fasciclin domain-containing protein [Rhodothermaceae bacterium]|nr:fasciclin domain-containing protein [Rhodothermaceae bacterium]